MLTLTRRAHLHLVHLAQALAMSFEASVAVAKSALRKHNPDVVVGFSWGKVVLVFKISMADCANNRCGSGGAITVELIRNGDWQGSTVLLAPAHKLLDGFMQREMPIPALDATKTVVVHSTGDTLVPIAHSMELEREPFHTRSLPARIARWPSPCVSSPSLRTHATRRAATSRPPSAHSPPE